jgi:hypothetical protein
MRLLRYILKELATLSALAIPMSADSGLLAMGLVVLIAIPVIILSLIGIGFIDELDEHTKRKCRHGKRN